MGLWMSIREGCVEIAVRLDHVNGDIAAVQACFEALLKVEELLRLPTTTCFVDGLTYRGYGPPVPRVPKAKACWSWMAVVPLF